MFRQLRKLLISGGIGLGIFLAVSLYSQDDTSELSVEASESVSMQELSLTAMFPKPYPYVVKEQEEVVEQEPIERKISTLKPEDITSPYAILIRLQNQEVLFEKNSDTVMYPASLTKIMTAIVAIEMIPDLNETITLTKESFEGLKEAGASMAGFLPGEEIRSIDLLYGLLLPSGAECGKALAYQASGSVEAFVERMNEKAELLGMKQTHFMNTTGLHHPDHYTSISDLSILLQYALHNAVFRDVYTSSHYDIPADNKYSDGILLKSTLFKHEEAIEIDTGEIIGGKTGYTSVAGLCLSSLATIDNEEYIFISAGAQGNHYTPQYNIEDAVKAYNSIQSEEDKQGDTQEEKQEDSQEVIEG